MLNQVTLIGRLGADPEITDLTGGRRVAKMRVATWKSWWNKEKPNPENGQLGMWETESQWHTVIVWGDNCRACEKLHKGDCVLVEGSIQTREWEYESKKHYATEVVGRVRATPVPNPQSRTTDPQGMPSQPTAPTHVEQAREPGQSDDLPF